MFIQEWEGLTIGSLLPGMLVNAKVRNVLSDGLLVSFLTFFNGTIDCFHLSQVLALLLCLINATSLPCQTTIPQGSVGY